MPNLSQIKRERMMAFLQKIKDEHRDDDEMLIALGEIESELNAKKYGLVWEQHEEAVDVMMQDNIPVFTEVAEKEIIEAPGDGFNFILEGDNLHSLRLLEKTHNEAIRRAEDYGYNLRTISHRYFMVEKFYPIDFRKSSKNPIQKSKFFNLADMFGYKTMPDTEKIAADLNGRTWEEF